MKKRILGLLAVALLAGPSVAQAALINFEDHPSTTSLSGVPSASAVVTDYYSSLGVIFGRAGVSAGVAVVNNSNTFSTPNGACGLDAAGSIPLNCTGDIYFHFVNPSDGLSPATTNAISFVLGDSGGDLDSWLISVFDSSDNLLEARVVTSEANISQAFSYSQMARVWISWTGGGGGYLFDNLDFATPTPPSSVPEPGTLALLGLGLVGMGLARRKKAS